MPPPPPPPPIYVKIQPACKCFLERIPDVGQIFLQNRTVSMINMLCFFLFYAEIQDGRQKWWENNICQQVADDSAYILGLKNFVEIALSCIVSKIHVFLHFTQKFKMAAMIFFSNSAI